MSATGWDLVVSYGDLSRSSGYRSRVLGELQHLDSASGLNPYLLLFDRAPEDFRSSDPLRVPFRAHARSQMMRFYADVARLSRQAPIRLVHAHNLYSAALALSARLLHGYKVILDYHGRIPEEYVFLGKGGRPSRKVLEHLERWAVRHADHIIVVSARLREYLQETYSIPPGKLSVIPCCADPRLFRYQPELREETRRKLHLHDRFVCTHLGSFFEWYEPEFLIKVFKQIQEAVSGIAHLLIVTAESVRTNTYLSRHLDPPTFTVITATHEDVPALLNASDLGFLLLRSSRNIRTSSPVKFAEYLNCGVPVMITPEVGDYSELVQTSGTGIVLRPDQNIGPDLAQWLRHPREQQAEKCTAAGRAITWDSFRGIWTGALNRILVNTS
jgi:glycosyltransferase involved in cell wall biosynthesis